MDCAYGAAQPAVSTLRSTRPLSFQTQESEMEVLKTNHTSGVQPHIATRSTDTRARGMHTPSARSTGDSRPHPRAIDTHTSFHHCWSPGTGSRQQYVEVSTWYISRHRAVRLACAEAHVHTRRLQAEKHPPGSITAHMYPLRPTVASTPMVSHRLRTSTRTGMYPIHARADVDESAVMHRGRCLVTPRDIHIRSAPRTGVPLAESPCASPITLSPAPHQTCRALREYLQLVTHPPPSRARSRSPTPHSAPGPTAAGLQ
ncbi:hypothetical protein B0H13DRAFT_2362164 [Mycena leptocephala]|nr:hypothetical protein B0H13DRAFT_2362164 [Mycena leptocephala]